MVEVAAGAQKNGVVVDPDIAFHIQLVRRFDGADADVAVVVYTHARSEECVEIQPVLVAAGSAFGADGLTTAQAESQSVGRSGICIVLINGDSPGGAQ